MSVSRRSFLACLGAAIAAAPAACKLKYDTLPGVKGIKLPGPMVVDRGRPNIFRAVVWDTARVEPETASSVEMFFPPLPPQFVLTRVAWSLPSDTLADDIAKLCNGIGDDSAQVVMMRNGLEMLRLSLGAPFWRREALASLSFLTAIDFEPAVLLRESDQFCLRFEAPALDLSRPVNVQHTLQGIATL